MLNLFKFSLGFSLISPIFKDEPAKAFLTKSPDTNSVADLSTAANPCFLTPEMLKVKFYEIGFCTSDPLATGTFVNTTCSKSWDNASGFETDIGKKSFVSMVGTIYKVPNNDENNLSSVINQATSDLTSLWSMHGKDSLGLTKNQAIALLELNG